MPIAGAVVLLIQFCFAYHALKTGRPYWWVFIIMGFPVMGCVIYYFVEVFPGSREQRRAAKTARAIARVLEPDAELKKRVEDLEICGSVDNKTALAEECMQHQMYPEAIKLYESLLMRLGKSEAAMQMFNEVVTHARRYSSGMETEEQWAEAAREAIAGN